MTAIETARDILDPAKLNLPPNIPVLRIETEAYTDMDGEDSLRVNVIIADDTVVENVGGKNWMKLKMAIRDSLLDQDIRLFPYIFIAKPSELAETDED